MHIGKVEGQERRATNHRCIGYYLVDLDGLKLIDLEAAYIALNVYDIKDPNKQLVGGWEVMDEMLT